MLRVVKVLGNTLYILKNNLKYTIIISYFLASNIYYYHKKAFLKSIIEIKNTQFIGISKEGFLIFENNIKKNIKIKYIVVNINNSKEFDNFFQPKVSNSSNKCEVQIYRIYSNVIQNLMKLNNNQVTLKNISDKKYKGNTIQINSDIYINEGEIKAILKNKNIYNTYQIASKTWCKL